MSEISIYWGQKSACKQLLAKLSLACYSSALYSSVEKLVFRLMRLYSRDAQIRKVVVPQVKGKL